MSVTLDPQSAAFCLGAFIERDRLKAELAAAQAKITDLTKQLEDEEEPDGTEPA